MMFEENSLAWYWYGAEVDAGLQRKFFSMNLNFGVLKLRSIHFQILENLEVLLEEVALRINSNLELLRHLQGMV